MMEKPLNHSYERSRALSLIVGSGQTHVGPRANNEDVVVVDEGLGLFAVLDGMGGHPAGEVAAELAGQTVTQFIRTTATRDRNTHRDLLESGIRQASVAVYTAGKRNAEWDGMGCTIVACLVFDSTYAVIGHVGDSRAYLLRDHDLQLLTRDHNEAQEALESGRMSAEDIEFLNLKHVLSRTIGSERAAQPDMLELEIQPGDRILLCSDGLYDSIPESQLERLLGAHAEPRGAATALVGVALESGVIKDNVSAVVVDVRRNSEPG